MASTKIPEDVGEIYEKIHAETVWLHHRWACYSELFRHTPRRIELLNASAPTFFFIVQELIERDVVLSFSRLTDPARDNRKNENISLDMLQERLKSLSAPESEQFIQSCQELLGRLKIQCKPLLHLRRKVVAHFDLKVALCKHEENRLPNLSFQVIEDALGTLRDYLNMIERYFSGNHGEYYFYPASNNGGAESLIAFLRYGLRCEELLQQEKISPLDLNQGDWHDA